jgi:hypothetical protein
MIEASSSMDEPKGTQELATTLCSGRGAVVAQSALEPRRLFDVVEEMQEREHARVRVV